MRRKVMSALAVMAAVSMFSSGATAQGGPPRFAPLLMETDAFEDGGIVPPKYAGRGENVQPGFRFSNLPEGTVSFAIIFHDIDVGLQGGTGDVLHWLAWNIPASAGGIPEGGLSHRLEEWVPSWLIFFAKLYGFFFLYIWFRGTLPRLRIDQLMDFCWKVLLPIAILNAVVTAIVVVAV